MRTDGLTGETSVELDGLLAFIDRAEGMLAEAEAAIGRMNTEISMPIPVPLLGDTINASTLPAGGFEQSTQLEERYVTMYNTYCDRIDRLRFMLIAIKDAASSIHSRYSTTEELNTATVDAITRELDEASIRATHHGS